MAHTTGINDRVPPGRSVAALANRAKLVASSVQSALLSRGSSRQDSDMRDLAPHIFRQRLVVEARCQRAPDAETIAAYLRELGDELGMRVLADPVTHRSDRYGWAGWVHWENSGAHVYAWDEDRFVSVDIYTCKAFKNEDAVEFTRSYFGAYEIESREL